MWLYRSFLAILGGSCLVILSAALARTAASPDPARLLAEPSTVAPAPAPRANADAERTLDNALLALQPQHLRWLETTIWQKVQLPGYVYEADGSYQLAPGQRFRLEMHSRFGARECTLLMVSDGREMWQGERANEGNWQNVTRLNLPKVFSVMRGPAEPRLRREFLQRPHFRGMTPLLCDLRSRLVWANREILHHGGAELIRLVGVWPKEEASKHAPAGEAWPIGLPRQCHLYLDAKTHWLKRIEWWGPAGAANDDALLVQMEFRNPIFNRPLSAKVCGQLFVFQPGDAAVEDETASVAAEMTRRAGQLTMR